MFDYATGTCVVFHMLNYVL